jgi:hypothetical protein
MVAFGPGISCRDAEPYHYDYLCGSEAEIPQAVVDHIRHCEACGAQIEQLAAAVGAYETHDCRSHGDGDVAGALGLHFAHLGEEITCAKAKSFLPMLLVPSMQIRIPTPVTVHLDHCPQCTEDLESLRKLGLRPEQLARLSRLYAGHAADDPHMCRRARAKTWAFACASFEGIDPEVLEHVCTCPRCRRRVYWRRQKILAGRQPGDTIAGVALCNGISTADLLEWVVPFGRTGDGQAPAGDSAMVSHLRTCPECIERMQRLHRTIYEIAERADSGVSTVYTAGVAAEASVERAESFYCGYPIHVAVTQREPAPVTVPSELFAPLRTAWQHVTDWRFWPAMRNSLAAAAMIAVAVVLFVPAQPVSGTREQQLTDTIRGIENLHISRYGRGGTKLLDEQWVARGAGLAMSRSQVGSRLYDLSGNDQARFESDLDKRLRQAMSATPVSDGSSSLPPDADKDVGQDVVVCEVVLDSPASNGPVMQCRLRCLLDSVTGLPRETRRYEMGPGETQWRLTEVCVFEYPDRQEAEAAVRGVLSER